MTVRKKKAKKRCVSEETLRMWGKPCFPNDTIGASQEAMFIEAIERLKDVGYGRMIQIIKSRWYELLRKDVSHEEAKAGALIGD